MTRVSVVGSQPSRIGAIVLAQALALLLSAAAPIRGAPIASEAASLDGKRLTRVLRQIRESGVPLVFSTRVVDRQLRVDLAQLDPGRVGSDDPRVVLRELLRPHDLELARGTGDTLVVRPAGRRFGTGAAQIEVRSRHSSEPVATARITVEGRATATVDGLGTLHLDGLVAGRYRLTVAATDFETTTLELDVAPAATARLGVLLQPLPYVADEILVQASEVSLLQDEPSSPSAFSREEIQSLPQLGGDLLRALSQLPGVAAGDLTARPSVRGSRQDELLTRIDGQELYEGFHLQDFDSAVSLVPGGVLGSASLQTGGAAAPFGDRTAGVLDLVTRQPLQLERRFSLSLLSIEAQVGATTPLDAARPISWFASARRGSIDLASRLFGRQDPEFWDLFGKLQVPVSDRHTLAMRALSGDDRLRFEEQDEETNDGISTDYGNRYLWLTHLAGIGSSAWVESALSRTTIERRRSGFENEDDQTFDVRDRRDQEILELRQNWFLHSDPAGDSDAQWRLGLQARSFRSTFDYRNQSQRDFVLVSDELPVADTASAAVGRVDGDHAALWISHRRGVKRWSFEMGLRGDRHSATDEQFLSPRLQLAWTPRSDSVLRAAWGVYHQSHRPIELQLENGETTLSSADRSSQWNLSWERSFGSALRLLRFEAYSRDFDSPRPRFESLFEPFNFFREVEPDRFLLTAGRARSRGIELTLRGGLGDSHRWWLNAAAQRSEDRITTAVGARWLPRETEQRGTLNVGWSSQLGQLWTLDLVGRIHSGWPTTPVLGLQTAEGGGAADSVVTGATSHGIARDLGADDPARVLLGPIRSERLETYSRIDLRLARTWQRKRTTWRLFFDVQNLLDQRNVSGFDLAVEDDELVIDRERWPGTFFSAGISWSF